MRAYTKVLTAVTVVGLAATMAACSSSSKKSAKPVAEIKDMSGGVSTSVILDPGFVKALTTLKVTPGLVGKATMPTPGTVTFPITGGHVKVYKKGDVTPYVQGEIDHNGSGLTLAAGGTTVTIENFVVDPGNNSKLTGEVLVDGKVFAKNVKLFDLDGSTLKTPTIAGGIATLQGTTVYLSADAAAALNKVFKITALAGDMKVKVGVAVIKAKA